MSAEEVTTLQVECLSPYDPRIKDTDVIGDLVVHDIDVVRYVLPGKLIPLHAFGASYNERGRPQFVGRGL